MRVVLGLSLTAGSAVWVLVDTYDGRIIADEVVPLESLNEIARATARSVQTFALQSERDIDGVRLVWDDEGRRHGIRLRTKLRLFGFDTVDTVSEDAAREGRNRTARHIAPHLVLAYGAARADLDDADNKGVLRRLVAKVPGRSDDRGGGMPPFAGRVASMRGAGGEIAMRMTDGARKVVSTVSRPVPARAAGVVLVAAVAGAVGYALIGPSGSGDAPDTAVANAVVPAPPAPAPAAVAPAPIPAAPQGAAVESPPAPALITPDQTSMPEYASAPTPVTATDADVAVAEPQVAEVPDATTVTDNPAVYGAGSTLPEQYPATAESPHLTGTGPAAGPVQPVAAPMPSAQAAPATIAPAPPAPGGPLGALFGALP